MAYPGDKKGKRRGSCGHVMASFDLHDKCARCRDKLIGEDDCVQLDKPCKICDGFSDIQKEMLATQSYKIRKDEKAGLLVSPIEVTILQLVDNEPTFQSPSGQSTQPSAHPSSPPPSSSQSASFVTADQLAAISDKWAEQFAHMEVLLSRGNVFSTPVSAVKPVDTQPLISQTPFLVPATRPTGPVEIPVAVDASVKAKSVDQKEKKSHKSRKDKHSDKSVKTDHKVVSSDPKSEKKGVSSRSEKNVTGLPHRLHDQCLKNRNMLLPLRLIPAPVRSLLISPVCLKGTITSLLQAMTTLPVLFSGQPQRFLSRIKIKALPVPVPVLTHRLQK